MPDMKYKCSTVNLTPCQPWRHIGKAEVHFHLTVTWALDGVECSDLHQSHFTHRKHSRYPVRRRLGGPQSQSGDSEEQISCPARIWTPIVQLMVQLLYQTSHPISNFLQQCGCNDVSMGKVSTWFLSADKVNGGKCVLTHHGPPYDICMLHIPVPDAKHFIHDTNQCTLDISKYSSLSLPQVSASCMPSSGSFRQGLGTCKTLTDHKSNSCYITLALQLMYTMWILQTMAKMARSSPRME